MTLSYSHFGKLPDLTTKDDYFDDFNKSKHSGHAHYLNYLCTKDLNTNERDSQWLK